MLKVSSTECARQQVIKNLLTAHGRAAENGDAGSVIRLSKYLLRLLKQEEKLLIQLGAESEAG